MRGMPPPVQRDVRHHLRLAQTGVRRPARRDMPVRERLEGPVSGAALAGSGCAAQDSIRAHMPQMIFFV